MGSRTSIQIRTAAPDDSEGIATLSSELGYETTSNDVREKLVQLLKSQEHGIYVAVDHAGTVIGWAHVFSGHRLMVDSFAELGGLVVTESHHRTGIGNQLLQAAEKWSLRNGLGRMRIRSKISREAAHKFYTSKDYATIKSQRVFEKIF